MQDYTAEINREKRGTFVLDRCHPNGLGRAARSVRRARYSRIAQLYPI